METKKETMALFHNVKHNYSIPLRRSSRGDDTDRDGEWVRITEFVEVDFPLLSGDVVAEAKRSSLEKTRQLLQDQLAALDSGDEK